MKRLIPAITITMMGLQLPVAAWGSRNNGPRSPNQNTQEVPNTPGLKRQDNRHWLIEADYLFWKPVMENSEFALKTTTQDNPAYTVTTKSVLKQPSFHLSSGVRLGLGGYSSDSWDVSLRGTYLYSGASRHPKIDTTEVQTVTPEWFTANNGVAGQRAVSQWKMNFYLLDLSIGREYFLTKRFSTHPFIGIRGAAIYMSNRNHYDSIFTVNAAPVTAPQTFKAKENIWGIGPRIGLDLNFYVSSEWAFVGGFAGSLLCTHYNVKEKFYGDALTGSTLDPIYLTLRQKNNLGRANLDAYFGVEWSHWFNSNNNRISIGLAFEAQQWFNLNQFFSLDFLNGGGGRANVANVAVNKNHGDLSLVGGTVHLQVDF